MTGIGDDTVVGAVRVPLHEHAGPPEAQYGSDLTTRCMVSVIDRLKELRDYGGERQTVGLDDAVIERFAASDPRLGQAVEQALAAHQAFRDDWGDALQGPEVDLITSLQSDFVNFYPAETVNPYVPLAALGPWIVTTHGAVLHDNGGYGMLGAGHAPEAVLSAMSAPHVMANIMTPSFSHKRFTRRLKKEIGQQRGHCPFERFICMNSGSESVTVACRISDVLAKRMTDPGGPKEGQKCKFLALSGAFHGRTDRPALASHSSRPKYRSNLRSHRDADSLITTPPNDVEALRRTFAQAEADGVFIEMMLIEPVMGEGNPGESVSRAFYDAARELTKAHGSLLLVDSIQAGIRGTGYLSVVDYPGLEDVEPPDMETYSKALNAGQYPMSVLALTERAANLYVRGIYGNTMTANPKALEVGCTVLESLTPELRVNIRERGAQLVAGLQKLAEEFPSVITRVQGTGLLCSAEIDPAFASVVGFDGLEMWCRRHGLGVIHGGKNALRFTPTFGITAEEIELVIDLVRESIQARLTAEAISDKAVAAERVRA